MITKKTIDKYVGKTFENIYVISYSHNSSPCHPYFNCKCNNCGTTLKMRPDAFTKNKVGCNNCMGKWRSENFQKMYSHLEPKHLRFRKTHLKCQAISRGYDWNLTDEQVYYLIKQPCYYCGTTERIGIDRIDNLLGYDFNNSVPCCGYCNRLKMNNTLSDFIHKIYNIYNHYIKESSTTIPKGSTSQVNGDGKGRHLSKENKKTEMKIWSDLQGDLQLQQNVA